MREFLSGTILPVWPWDFLLGLVIVCLVGIVPLAVTILSKFQAARTEHLREEFGPDYDALVNEHGDWRRAEQVLLRRRKERDAHIHWWRP